MMQRTQYKDKTFTIVDFYKKYLQRNPKGSKNYLTQNQFRDIMELHFQLSLNVLITTGEPMNLLRLGELIIKKRRPEPEERFIDFKKTKELGTIVYHNNTHSNGYYARFKWDKGRIYLKNKAIYKFKTCRWADRLLKKEIVENNTIVKYYG